MGKKGHGWIIPLKIITALIVAGWLPVRIVFLSDVGFIDRLFDAFIFALVFGPYFVRAQKLPVHGKQIEEDSFWQRMGSVTVDLAVGLPFVSIAAGIDIQLGIWWWVPKLILLRHISGIKKVLECYDSLHPILQRLLPLGFVMPTVVHLAACGWVWMGGGTAGITGNAFEDYVKSLYFIMTTFTTVGYGDISAKTLPQMGYAMLTQIVGVGFFGFVVSNVASLLARMDAARENHLSTLDRIEAFMGHNDLPHRLRVKVRSYYRYLWDTRHGYDDKSILNDLPNKLRSEVSLCLNAEIMQKVPLFNGADTDMLEDVVLQLRPKVVVPGEKIFHAGEPGDSMYFIHKGSVEIVTREGGVLATLLPGSFFGEMALLTSNPRSANARATEYCDMFELSREAFEKVLGRYPLFEKHIRDIAVERGIRPEVPLNSQDQKVS